MTAKACTIRVVSQQFKDRTNTVIKGVMAHLRDDNAEEILGPGMSSLIGRHSLESIVTFALYADVLRMVYDVLAEYEEIGDEDLQESLVLLSMIAAGFAKVPKDYASSTQLTFEAGRHFLSQYESDAGLFGYANEATGWAGTGLCRNIDLQFGEPGPHEAFLGLLGHLADHTLLTKEIAEVFLQSNHELSLDEFTAIVDDAAALLANSKDLVSGACLSLDGLKSLSASSAAALASYDGDLSLCGLETLSPEVAATLAKHTHRLQLGGLVTLPDEVAEALALHRPTSVRFNLQAKPTLSVGGYNGECELTPRGLRALAMYSGCLELSCDFSDKSEESEWAEPLRIFHARQDQRLFKSFSSRILEILLERKEASGLQELADWTFSEAYGKSPWEIFDEFKDLMSACGNRTVWLHVHKEYGERPLLHLFVGDEDAVVRRIETLPDKT